MRSALTLLGLGLLVACGRGASDPRDAAPVRDDAAVQPDAATTLGTTFSFAVVGDTRPPDLDNLASYPEPVITKIWQDVEAFTPHPDFAVSTGDYLFASSTRTGASSTVDRQLDLYLTARAYFHNAVFAAMGNHECTGATASNCGPGSRNGVTFNCAEYLRRMVAPYGFTQPYFAYEFAASDASWTAKVVVVAANAWSPAQAAWLDQELARPTTYTFVVRHENVTATTAPGVMPSEQIIARYPLTLKIVGHTHTYKYDADHHELVCGNGGAPLSSGADYGYAIVERLAGGAIQVTEYDYMSNAQVAQFRVNADGSPAP